MATEESILTSTQRAQRTVEYDVFKLYNNHFSDPQSISLKLARDRHIEYLTKGLRDLTVYFQCLDASRPWLCYWILHSLDVLGEPLDDELRSNAVDFLRRCQDPNGGYCGGPGQLPHLAVTYAAVNSLITLGGDRSLSSINREKLYTFLSRMKDPCGGFRMHEGGEMDVRACYTAISVASILNILTEELVKNVGNYIASCQTYEGGIGAEPGLEAHGGYTFCGLATMILINEVHQLDLSSLINWAVFRQGVEGGFQGRTNKLVDGCYSWQGGIFALIQRFLPMDEEATSDKRGHRRECDESNLFNSLVLQTYLLVCCQAKDGGLIDKPGQHTDFYHTCYCLSGLSVCQYIGSKDGYSAAWRESVLGPYKNNVLEPIHPVYNVVLDRYLESFEFFSR